MNTLVIVKAGENKGKTSTLNFLIDKIKKQPNCSILPSSYHFGGNDNVFIAKIGNDTIGVITAGDPGYENDVEKILNESNSPKCDLVFVASRTKGKIYETIWAFGQNNNIKIFETSPYVFFPNWGTGINADAINKACADALFTLISNYKTL